MRISDRKISISSYIWITSLSLMTLAVVGSPAQPQESQTARQLARSLGTGQAVVWYLYHSGWAVKSKKHLLIFDYIEPPSPPAERSLGAGVVSPEEISGQNVTVFVSHSHSDHYDPIIDKWRTSVPKIQYVWGWEGAGFAEDIHFGRERQTSNLDGIEILNVHHEFDGIPESAFLVKVDGLTIFFAGDHGHSKGLENPAFKSNLDYLVKQAPDLDLFFTPTFGGEMSAIEILKPRAVFPMHDGGREEQYNRIAERLKKAGFEGSVGAASRGGNVFLYSEGRLASPNLAEMGG